MSIQVGGMNPDESLRRGVTLPLKVLPRASAEEIREAAVLKHKAFNRKFSERRDTSWSSEMVAKLESSLGLILRSHLRLSDIKRTQASVMRELCYTLRRRSISFDALERVIKDESSDDEVQGEDIGDDDAPVVTSEHCDKCNYERTNTVERLVTEGEVITSLYSLSREAAK